MPGVPGRLLMELGDQVVEEGERSNGVEFQGSGSLGLQRTIEFSRMDFERETVPFLPFSMQYFPA